MAEEEQIEDNSIEEEKVENEPEIEASSTEEEEESAPIEYSKKLVTEKEIDTVTNLYVSAWQRQIESIGNSSFKKSLFDIHFNNHNIYSNVISFFRTFN